MSGHENEGATSWAGALRGLDTEAYSASCRITILFTATEYSFKLTLRNKHRGDDSRRDGWLTVVANDSLASKSSSRRSTQCSCLTDSRVG